MKSNIKRAVISLTTAGVAVGLAFVASTAMASPGSHVGDPALWGPALEALCDDPTLPAAQGYNLIEDPIDDPNDPNDDPFVGGLLEGTDGPDLILARSGNDTVNAGGGNDVVCGSFGNDHLNGEGGNDALFGGGHHNTLRGGNGRDYLDGGGQLNECDGGNNADATGPGCDVVAP